MPDHILHALMLYLHYVIQDGDYLNDWLTHLPTVMRTEVLTLGKLITGKL